MPPTQQRLAELMSRISEEAWFAGWMDGLEFALWRIVLGGPRKYGQIIVDEVSLKELRRLSNECGGWIRWGENDCEEFVSLAEWQSAYERWLAAR